MLPKDFGDIYMLSGFYSNYTTNSQFLCLFSSRHIPTYSLINMRQLRNVIQLLNWVKCDESLKIRAICIQFSSPS